MAGKKSSIKCKFCRVEDLKVNMVDLQDSSVPKSYHGLYHPECRDAYLALRVDKDIDNEERDKLNALMKQIYGVDVIPPNIWIRLDYLRWGKRHHNEKKQITKPIRYQIIYDAFVLAQKSIDYVLRTKSFDSTGKMMLYCHSIMLNYINDAYNNQRNNEKAKEKLNVNSMSEIIEIEEEREKPQYKPKKRKTDISHLLD